MARHRKQLSLLLMSFLCVSLAQSREHSNDLPQGGARYTTSPLVWYDARYLTVEGRAFTDTENFWERLPVRAKAQVPPAVWGLSKHTAGICVRFRTDSTTIAASWDGAVKLRMNHMALTGSAGLDLYRREGGQWRYVATGRPREEATTQVLVSSAPSGLHEYLLYLPLYHPVSDLRLGFAPEAKVLPGSQRPAQLSKPLVFYGTSITQGGCASRAGMCHTALLGRWLNRPVINLGFSGSGKGEREMAQLVAEIDASVFILEPLPNMTTDQVRERIPQWLEILRDRHPRTPIVLVANPLKKSEDEQNRTLAHIYKTARARGIRNLYFIPAEPQLAGSENGTVDGIHPTDLGFFRMACCYEKLLRRIIEE